MADEPEKKSGLSVQTLLISSAAAVVAATIVPLFWEKGTIFATAMMPVVVALVSEGLRKPVQTVSAVAPRVARRSGTGAALRRPNPVAASTEDHDQVGARGEGPERFEPLPEHLQDAGPALREDDPFGLRTARRPRPRLKIALLTGALAFVLAAAVVTASELALFGGSVSSDRRTSLFGGEKKAGGGSEDEAQEGATPTATPDEGEATPDPAATPEPTATATPTPPGSATPSPTPAEPTPAPTP